MKLLALAATMLSIHPAEGQDGESSLYPFIPIQSVATKRVAADGSLTCSMFINGERQNEGCDPAGRAEQALRQLGREAELTMVFSIVPAGSSAPSEHGEAGELIVEARAQLQVDADGRVAECRQSVRRVLRSAAGVRAAPDLCRAYRVGHRMFVPDSGTASRSADLSVLLFFRERADRR